MGIRRQIEIASANPPGPSYRFGQSDLHRSPIDLPYFDQGRTRYLHAMLVMTGAYILAR